jgi:phage-related protein
MVPQQEKPAEFVASAKDDLVALPEEVRREFGHAIYLAQIGMQHANAKPLRGFGGAGVMEVVENEDGDTYRAVYTVKFAGVVYVLHAFQKKSKKGDETPKHEIDLIKRRLKAAEEHYKEHYRRAG